MKRLLNKIFFLIFFFSVLSPALKAEALTEEEKTRVRFAYDLGFDMNFDNREFYPSRFSSSMTIFGARLTPTVGADFAQTDGFHHRLMFGIDIMKDFGDKVRNQNWDLFREVLLYYSFDKQFGKTGVSLTAGIFPRTMMEGEYDRMFFSDSLKFYDNNLEGLLLKFRRPHAYYEIGCDWMGQISEFNRERFMIFAHGHGQPVKSLTLGYSAYMYHFACSGHASGVVDNMMLEPYIRFDAAAFLPLQRFSLSLGWIQTFQQDRKFVGKYIFPGGGNLVLDLCNWNVGIRNSLYYGRNLMPYYNSMDESGAKYGNLLYPGDPFYRVRTDGSEKAALYDCLEIYWRPYVGRFLKINVSALFHFNGGNGFQQGYSGCQQMVGIQFDLHELLNRKK